MLKPVSIYSLVLALAACGGGGGGNGPGGPVTASSAPAAPSAGPIPIVTLYGDSTQVGGPGGWGGGVSAASIAKPILQGVAELRNEGASGTTAVQLLRGTDGRHHAWALEMASSPAHVVVTNHGINDWAYSPESYREALQLLVDGARRAGKVMMLETPNPVNRTEAYSIQDFERRVQIMRDVAEEEDVYLCDVFKHVVDAGHAGETDDGLHPLASMYEVIGAHLATCIKEALHKG